MKVVLTGAKGNLGTTLRSLGEGIDWLPITRENWQELPGILSSEVDVILHAASDLTSIPANKPTAVVESNILTTARLLEAARENGIKRFVFISTCAVYGRMQTTTEDTAPAPISLNGMMKVVNEGLVQDFCRQNDISYEIYRLFNMYGGTDHFSILSHIKAAVANDRPFVLNNDGISQRDFVHVEDVAKILIHFLRTPPDCNFLNIGSGEATKIGEIVEAIRQRYPALKVERAYRAETEYSRADISRLRRNLGDYKFRDVIAFISDSLVPN